MLRVHASPQRRVWTSPLLSAASFIAILAALIVLVSPLLIAIRSGGFLIHEATYREEPLIFFQNEIVVSILDEHGLPLVYWSSIPDINNLLGDKLRFPVLKVQEKDNNYDGRPDQLHLQLKVPLTETEELRTIAIFLGFSYQLRNTADLTMQSLAYITESSLGNPRQLYVTGDLKLVQKSPLPSFGTRTEYNTSLLRSNAASAADFTFPNILRTYSARTESTRIENKYATWMYPRNPNELFTIDMDIFYPSQLVSYTPSLWHELKFIWIQYVALLLPFLWITRVLKQYIFEKGVIAAIPHDTFVKPHSS
eukprot:m.128121 g.128121  ORF g.128121 m.128121 type:complete len:309 (+) comp15668_c1_seq16:373-1299(+)